jgi:hypothetical protein
MGEYRRGVGSFGDGPAKVWWPTGIDVAGDGSVYITDRGSQRHQVHRFALDGHYLGSWGAPGRGEGYLRGPFDVAAAPEGTVYVADTFNRRVQAFGVAPDHWRAEFYGNSWLAGPPLAVTNTREVSLDWGVGPPATELPADGFSVRLQRHLDLAERVYRFRIEADGGTRLWVGRRLLFDEWKTGMR